MNFRSAQTEEEALSWLAELGSGAQVLAGGTDVMIQYMRGEISPSVLLHIERLDDLRGTAVNERVDLGPLTTHRRLVTDELINREFMAVAEGANTVGGWQTQEAGTIGGNICNASPAADLAPPLLVANAEVGLRSTGGARTLPLADFFEGRRQTARRPDELVTNISLERPGKRTGEVYLKLGRRGAMEVAIVGLAARFSFAEDGETVSGARVALCSVSPRPYRATEAEQVLVGSRLEHEALAEAGRLLTASASPIDDVRSGANYRLVTLAPLLERAAAVCRDRAAA
ncbi:MAG: FAD binding domain-containing protein [Acidimicrobiia bacterium]